MELATGTRGMSADLLESLRLCRSLESYRSCQQCGERRAEVVIGRRSSKRVVCRTCSKASGPARQITRTASPSPDVARSRARMAAALRGETPHQKKTTTPKPSRWGAEPWGNPNNYRAPKALVSRY